MSENLKTKKITISLNEKETKKLKMVLEYFYEPKKLKDEKEAFSKIFIESLDKKYNNMLDELNELK